MNPRLIVIDGKTYNSVDEMPADVRARYEQAMRSLKDQNGNRVPDVFENDNMLADKNGNGIPDIVENSDGTPIIKNVTKILVNGKEFRSLDELPPEARAKYEQAMGALDADHNGVPDFVEGMMGNQVQQPSAPASTSFGVATPRPISSAQIPNASAVTPDTSNGWLLALLIVGLLFVCAVGAAGVWYFFLR